MFVFMLTYSPFVKRCIFCVDTNNILKCYRYDVEEDEWVELPLHGGGEQDDIVVHSSSRTEWLFAPAPAASSGDSGGYIVFYQDLAGRLQGVRIQNQSDSDGNGSTSGRREYLPVPIPTQSHPQVGTPHLVVVSDDGGDGVLHLLYIHREDGRIHHLTTKGVFDEGSRWEDMYHLHHYYLLLLPLLANR